jgi:hypothetical protein
MERRSGKGDTEITTSHQGEGVQPPPPPPSPSISPPHSHSHLLVISISVIGNIVRIFDIVIESIYTIFFYLWSRYEWVVLMDCRLGEASQRLCAWYNLYGDIVLSKNMLFHLFIISLSRSKDLTGTQDPRIDQGNEKVWVVLHPLDRNLVTDGIVD